jgi:hypothetical protein
MYVMQYMAARIASTQLQFGLSPLVLCLILLFCFCSCLCLVSFLTQAPRDRN